MLNIPVMKFRIYTNGTATIHHEGITCSNGVWPIITSVCKMLPKTLLVNDMTSVIKLETCIFSVRGNKLV